MAGGFSISAEKMRDILEVSRLLAVTEKIDELLLEIARATQGLLGAERASIFLHDPAKRQLWTMVALGADQIRIPDGAGIAGSVFRSKALLNIPDAYADPRFNRDVDKRTGFVTRNLLTAPVFDLTGQAIGILQAVNKVGGVFADEDEQAIQLLSAQCGVAVQRYYLQLDVIKAAELTREMDLAKSVQEWLLPKRPPRVEGLEAVGWTRSASVTGGDTFDLWTVGKDKIGVFLGDAAGHGLAPALEVVQARTLARALSDINCDPSWILSRVNARLVRDFKIGHFVTAFVGCVGRDGEVVWCSAGHGPVLYRRSPDDPVQRLDPPAPPIAVEDDLAPDPAEPIRLGHGGALYVMSDGIFEAMDPGDQQFTVDRVVEVLDAQRTATPEAQLASVREAVHRWQGKDDPADDQSIVIVQRR